MTLLQTLAKLWARWFCRYHADDYVSCNYACINTPCLDDDSIICMECDKNKQAFECVGIKCKGCPLKESK